MKKLLLILLCLPMIGFGQGWEKTFFDGGYSNSSSVQQTADGGYINTGGTTPIFSASQRLYILKTDANGDLLWTKLYGDAAGSYGYEVQQTADGGYIVLGSKVKLYTNSGGSYYRTHPWLIKTDANGDSLWTRTFIGDTAYWNMNYRSVQQTTDGGYILAGKEHLNILLKKIDANGDSLWDKTFFGANLWQLSSSVVKQTTDGGYSILGGVDMGGLEKDALLLKTDANGDSLWSKTFGGTGIDGVSDFQETSGGGYIITGSKATSLGYGFEDVWLIKTDSNGVEQWTKTFGDPAAKEIGYSVEQTTDGGYVIAGYTNDSCSYDTNGDGIIDLWTQGSANIFLIKTDANGDSLWTRTFIGQGLSAYISYGSSLQQTSDGGYIITGRTCCVNWPVWDGLYSVYLIKTDSSGLLPVYGCTDSLALNYNAIATANDSSCCYLITSISNVTECDTYSWNGALYTSSGTYTFTTTNSNGCDSIATLNLTINNSTSNSTTATSCDTYTWAVDGNTYTTSGTYTDVSTNASGCDHTDALYLTINYSPNTSNILGVTNVSYLQTETYSVGQNLNSTFAWHINSGGIILNGININSAEVQWGNNTGTFELYVVETAQNGCSDTVYIYVNVDNPALYGCTDSLACNYDALADTDDGSCIYGSSSYDTLSVTASIVWNGIPLSVSGDYSVTLTNSVGCDSIANLNLTVTTTGISDIANTKSNLVKITDVLGQETPYRRNTPLFYIYDDGTVEKRIVIE